GSEHAANLLHQLVHTKRFGDIRNAALLQKVPGLRGQHIAGDKEKLVLQRILGADQRAVKLSAVETRHFHVADGEIEILVGGEALGFASAYDGLHLETLV